MGCRKSRSLGVGWKIKKEEFPDVRQNEREIKFITVGDTVGIAGQLKGEPMLNGGP